MSAVRTGAVKDHRGKSHCENGRCPLPKAGRMRGRFLRPTRRRPRQCRLKHHQRPRPRNGPPDTGTSPDLFAVSAWQPSGKPGPCFLEPDRRHPKPNRRRSFSSDRRGEEWWPTPARAPSIERAQSPRAGSLRSLPHPPLIRGGHGGMGMMTMRSARGRGEDVEVDLGSPVSPAARP